MVHIRSKSDREGEILYDIPYMWNLKINDTNELIYKSERDSQTREKASGYQMRRRKEVEAR